MGRFCKICGRTRPNESFSGRGHSQCICKKCQKRPKEEIALIKTKDELMGYWEQSNISALNIARLRELTQFPCEDAQKLAHLTLAVAAVKPHKKRRMKWLRQNHRDLYLRVRDYFGDEYFAEYGFDDREVDEFEHTDDHMTFFQEPPTDDRAQSVFDDDESLPF